MDLDFTQLIDVDAFREVLASFHALTGIACGLYDTRGECLAKAGPEPLCRQWYALNPESARLCAQAAQVGHHDVRRLKQTAFTCRNGIGEASAPVVVRGRHVATLQRGQYFTQPPDFERYRAQARELGLDEEGFLKAIASIPVVSQEQVDQSLGFLAGMAALLAERGMAALEARDRMAEAKTAERVRFAQFSFEHSALPSAWVDETGKVVHANEAAAAMFGVTPSQAVGRMLPEVSPRFQAGTWDATWRALKENGTLNFESEIIDHQGRHIPLEVYYNHLSYGGVEYALVFGRDISSRVAIQQALMASEKHFRDLIDAAPFGVQLWSLMDDGRFVLSGNNRSADRILGLDHLALRGLPLEQAFPGLAKGAHGAAMRTVAATGARYETRTGGFVDDKAPRVFEVTGIQTGPGRMALFFRDITSEAKAQEEMEKTARLESLGVMAGGLAHDFNNLLTAIAGNISLALFDADEPARVRQYLADAETTAVRARGLTQQLLTFARGGAPQRKVARLDKLIRDSVRFVLTGSRHQSQFEIPAGLWPCMVDEGQINQVLHNLVINADQAMPEAGTITVGAENVRLKPGGGLPLPSGAYVRVWVADRGVGIAPEMQKKIFDPFFTTKKRGSGLGLASSFSIIRAHQGHLAVESTAGLGSTFSFYLPALPDQAPAEEGKPQAEGGGGLKVLVMDDEDMVRQMLAKMLQLMGHETVAVAGGVDCLARYKEAMASHRPFDLVVLDLTIPGEEGGAEVLRRLKGVDQKVRAIASSGYSTDPVLADFQNYGFVGRLPKPYSREELGLAVAAAMRA